MMEVGRKRDVEGASHQLLPPFQMNPGPDSPGSYFQLALGTLLGHLHYVMYTGL